MSFQELSIRETVFNRGVSRRDFLKFCSVMAGALALPKSGAAWIETALTAPKRVPVVWLELQDCAGCSEAFLRSNNPTAADIILDVLSIDYHETIMAAAGKQAEEAKAATIKAGGYILVVEGSVSLGDNGVYCCVGGRSSEDLIREAASNAVAVVAVGNCAAFGGIPKASPNPTGAKGAWEVITDRTVVNVPGCPAIPEVTTGTIAHFVAFGELPELDELNRPKTFYGHTVHDRCERLPFFRDEKYARSFDDDGAKQGWCLFKLGCKGPTTFNSCSSLKWYQGLSYPVEAGHPCLGCAEPDFWDRMTPFYQHLMGVPGFGAGSNIDTIGGLAVLGVGAAFAGHGVIQIMKRAADKAEPVVPNGPAKGDA